MDARIALVSPGGGGIDSICSQVISVPLNLQQKSKHLGSTPTTFVVIDACCVTLDIATEGGDDTYLPFLKVWRTLLLNSASQLSDQQINCKYFHLTTGLWQVQWKWMDDLDKESLLHCVVSMDKS
jgi:hypothetical protein